MSQAIGIALFGCGSVGTEVARLLLQRRDEYADRCGIRLELRHIVVREASKPRHADLPATLFTVDPRRALADSKVSIVVELAGGIDAAKALILDALSAGKDVVTANKALLASHGGALFAAARKAGRCIAFEASVCGGIPLIESVRRGLVANRIDKVLGILNGTCNYILTRMLENGASYAHGLAEAQDAGYAEADPSLDVSGVDSAHKLTILASLAMRTACDLSRVSVHGIERIELSDLTAGDELGYHCKLIAAARQHADGLELSVQPTFVPKSHPLAGVSGPFNAVSVYGDPVGHIFFYGRGAGGPATASAVISDLIDTAIGNARRTFESLMVLPDVTPPAVDHPVGETACPHYIRVGLRDQPGGIGKIATTLGACGISIATIVQHEPPQTLSSIAVPVVVTTHPAKGRDISGALAAMTKLEVVRTPPISIPVLEETSG